MKTFDDVFGGEPEVRADAPGRVNLLGEHTDYNDGLVLPTAIPQRTRVAMRCAAGALTTVYSRNLDERSRFTLDAPPAEAFARYLYGCLREAAGLAEVPPLDIYVDSHVPIGVGLSSSAALEVATLRALRILLGLDLDDVQLAQLAQRAEIEHAGVNCGILDQMASSLLEPGWLLFLDTRSLERTRLLLPPEAEVVVIDSGAPRSLASSGYNERRAQCERAAHELGLPSLREVRDLAQLERLPELLRRRARHVFTENARVRRAAADMTATELGCLMSESHTSLRDDYEVSTAALDELVALLEADEAVYGAKLTGAGFGGACVALCRAPHAPALAARVLDAYARRGRAGARLVPAP